MFCAKLTCFLSCPFPSIPHRLHPLEELTRLTVFSFPPFCAKLGKGRNGYNYYNIICVLPGSFRKAPSGKIRQQLNNEYFLKERRPAITLFRHPLSPLASRRGPRAILFSNLPSTPLIESLRWPSAGGNNSMRPNRAACGPPAVELPLGAFEKQAAILSDRAQLLGRPKNARRLLTRNPFPPMLEQRWGRMLRPGFYFRLPLFVFFSKAFSPQADSVYERSFVKVLEVINLGLVRSTGGYWERRCPPAILPRRTFGQFSSTAVCLQPARVNFQTRAVPHINFSQLISAPQSQG